jgi:uncharacterized damage-inducible protein DinB
MQEPDRREPPRVGTERELLESFLDYYRGTLLVKCAGLTEDQLRTRASEPSTLTLLGLVRHMTNVEQNWFQRIFLGDEVDFVYCGQRDREREFHDLASASSDQVERDFLAVCEQSRAIGGAHDLDEIERRPSSHGHLNLRWIYLHLIEEYARHCGHADLLRERIDGATGD